MLQCIFSFSSPSSRRQNLAVCQGDGSPVTLLPCRFVETRRNLHRPVQKLLTAWLPTAFKPPVAPAAHPRFPTSQASAITIAFFLSYPEKSYLCL